MEVVYSRFRKQRRLQKTFLNKTLLRIDYPARDLPIKVKFSSRSRFVLTYNVQKRVITVYADAWRDAQDRWKEYWQATFAHELGHAHDFTTLTGEERDRFFTETSGKPVTHHTLYGGVSVPFYTAKGEETVSWVHNDWAKRMAEFYADWWVHKHSDYVLFRPPNSPWQFDS